MLALAVAFSLAAPNLLPAQPWALGFAPSGRMPFVGDVDGDGLADLICVSPAGDSFIDVSLSRDGQKALVPQRANSSWGKDCQTAAVGEIDGSKGCDIVAVFNGSELRLAHAFKDGSFVDEKSWITLPKKLKEARLAVYGENVYAWDQSQTICYRIDRVSKEIQTIKWPKHLIRVEPVVARNGSAALFTFADGTVEMSEGPESQPEGELGHVIPGSFPIVANAWIFVDEPEEKSPTFVVKRPTSSFPAGLSDWAVGDIDGDGDTDVVQFRYGPEPHSGNNVLLYRFASKSETDNDHDGLSNEQEGALGTDPNNPDTDNDGLLDGWETGEYRGLNLKELGCDPKRVDLICLMSRFSNANKDMVERQIKNAQGYYESLGWSLHPVWLEEMKEEDQKKPWWEGRDRNLPAKWRGVAHWMQLTPWGGGQADQLGDGGGCGGNEWSLYATFIHEFGHQLGLSHEGFYGAAWCPTYPSMMNYAYSYGYEDDIMKIRYSDGSLKDFVMRETDLDETLPLPYDKVKFLEKSPYHYRLKANGATTLIDWNWNGVFGEKHVRADINYSYSTTAGRRDEVDHTWSAPCLVVHGKEAFAIYAQHGIKADGKSDPSVSAEKPGWLMLRRLIKPYAWEEPVKIENDGVTGDPVATSFKGELVVATPSVKGISVHWLRTGRKGVTSNVSTMVPAEGTQPSLGVVDGRLILFDWSPTSGWVHYRVLSRGHEFSSPSVMLSGDDYPVAIKSTVPVSMAVDSATKQVLIGMAQDQDEKRPSRWQIRRFSFEKNGLKAVGSPEWIEGEKGQARGKSRPTLLVDETGTTGMKGRLLFFGQGMTSAQTPWACEYVAQSVADKTVGNGWMVKRYYDEWTQSRSAPAAAWFNGDIIYAYRWVDGSQNDRDNLLHVAYNGTGIEEAAMGDFDDIGYMRDFGIRNSILYLRQ